MWDDRAAILANRDVVGNEPLTKLFSHDFWGQDITLSDSHKSYRPITVLSFRINYFFHGLSAAGFHASNVVIHGVSSIFYYWWVCQWVHDSYTPKVAAVLFVTHPIHVEAVASLVGRADSLSGAFFFLALFTYTKSLRWKGSTWIFFVFQIAAHLAALASSFSKEVGVTVYGVFVVLEVAEEMNIFRSASLLTKFNKDCGPSNDALFRWLSHIRNHADGIKIAAKFVRICASILVLALIMLLRRSLSGGQGLYQWTVLENHVSLMHDFTHRSLSYAQTHFWYLAKLVFPRYLCFDYGYACIPTVHSTVDPRNLLPLAGGWVQYSSI